jgi:hypothetical protein
VVAAAQTSSSEVFVDRRRFLITGSAVASSFSLRAQAFSSKPPVATLTLHPEQLGPRVPLGFLGLSYETQQLTVHEFFSGNNSGLIAQFRALGRTGVLRLGGDTSDLGWWKPAPSSTQPHLPPNVVLDLPPSEGKTLLDRAYAITPAAVCNLRAFLDATDWTCIYGINLGTSTPQRAAEEAAFVAETLGPKLEYFQIGNEPDLLAGRLREKGKWNAETFFEEWLAAATAVRIRVPHARFGLPDISGHVADWLPPITEHLAAVADRPEIAAISHHYYFTGPPTNPKANLADFLRIDPRVAHAAQFARAAAMKLNTNYRMTEGNSCYGGGKPGLSDVFAASLWAADYILQLASLGYAGFNFHGGGGDMVPNSSGGTLMANAATQYPKLFYTPIAHIGSGYGLEPVALGMKFAGYFVGSQMLHIDFDPGTVNATAYATKLADEKGIIAVINKDAEQTLTVNLPGYAPVVALTGESLTSGEARLEKPKRRDESVVPPATAVLFMSR